jgi:hypothetical protein
MSFRLNVTWEIWHRLNRSRIRDTQNRPTVRKQLSDRGNVHIIIKHTLPSPYLRQHTRNNALEKRTNSAGKMPSWEADTSSPGHEISHLLYNLRIHYHVYKNPPLNPIRPKCNHFTPQTLIFIDTLQNTHEILHTFLSSSSRVTCRDRLTLLHFIALASGEEYKS